MNEFPGTGSAGSSDVIHAGGGGAHLARKEDLELEASLGYKASSDIRKQNQNAPPPTQ